MLDFGMLIPFLQASPWALFIGRFHPVLVHLPIGFLLIAALLEIGRRSGKINISETTVVFVLFWSAISATFACIAGYLLSLGGGYDEELLSDHMWKGIGVAAFAWVAWLVKSDRIGKVIPFGKMVYLPAFRIAVLLTMSAGHDGGSLTHGEDYLTQYTPEPFRSLAGMDPFEEKSKEIKPIANVSRRWCTGTLYSRYWKRVACNVTMRAKRRAIFGWTNLLCCLKVAKAALHLYPVKVQKVI
jgi:hypothetical protein